jgi:ribosomal protein L29
MDLAFDADNLRTRSYSDKKDSYLTEILWVIISQSYGELVAVHVVKAKRRELACLATVLTFKNRASYI